jgi:putative peptidoglycan lipid II flippase
LKLKPMKFPFFTNTESHSINQKIFRAALIIGLLTLLTRIGTIVKELAVAKTFGRSDAMDAFLIAFLLPSFFITLVMGAAGSALVPVFVATRQNQGREAAETLLSSLIVITVAALTVLALLMCVLAPYYLPYMAHAFSPEKLRLTRELLYLLAPWLIFNGVGQLVTSVLNAGEKFALPALVPLVTPLVIIACITLAAAKLGAFALVAGSLGGSALEAALLVKLLRDHGIKPRLRWGGLDSSLRMVLVQYAPLLAGAFLMASVAVVDQSMAAMLPAGSVSALGYANRIVSGIAALGATALSAATLPYFSRMAAAADWAGCRHTLKRYVALIAATTVPFTLLLIAFSRPVSRLLYQRGAFTAADTELVSHIQSFFALQIPFLMLCTLLVRFLSAIRRNDLLMYGCAINLTVNITLNFALMKIWGVSGIALSTALVYMVSFLFLSACTLTLLSRGSSLESATVPAQASN